MEPARPRVARSVQLDAFVVDGALGVIFDRIEKGAYAFHVSSEATHFRVLFRRIVHTETSDVRIWLTGRVVSFPLLLEHLESPLTGLPGPRAAAHVVLVAAAPSKFEAVPSDGI